MLSVVYELTESLVGRLILVAAVALIVVPTVILGSTFVIRTTKRIWRYRRDKNNLKHLPQHTLSGLGMYQDPNEELEAKYKKYINPETGELYDLVAVGAGISGHQCVSVNDADLLQQMLTDPDPKGYPKAPLYEEVVADALLGDGLVTVTGLNQPKFERWQFHRRLLTPMFHFKALKDMIPMMVLYTKDLVEHLEKQGPEKWHRASDVLSRFTMSQIVWLAFGGTMDIDWLHERQLEIGHGWTKYAALHTFFGDWVQYVPFTPAWRIVQLRRETEGAIYNVIKQLREDGTATESHGHAQNLIATMLKSKNPKTGKPVTDREIVEEACTMLFAGYDTTSTTMSWALYYVAKDPDTLRWVQEELDSVLGFGANARDPTMEDLPNLKRTRAFINETLRLRPPLLTASRITTHPTKLGKYEIPADTIVNANIFLVHRNPKYWDDPHTFDPHRWDSNASDDADAAIGEKHDEKRRHPFAFVPFAAGARNCIGKNFAMQEMIIAMALILSKFNVEYDTTKPFSVFGSPVPTPDVYLKFHSRK